jgi:hypothetical protein
MEQPNWNQIRLGIAVALFGAGLIGARLMAPDQPWSFAVFVVGPLLIALGSLLALLGLRPSVASSKGYQRVRNVVVGWKIKVLQARQRARHGAQIRAWESFYEAAGRATYYLHEVYHDRLPLELAWPEFLRQLPDAKRAADALPAELRNPALVHLRRLSDRAAKGGATPSSSEFRAVYEGCNELGLWIDHQKRDRFPRKLYLRCGLQEPYWPDRIKTLSAEQLRANATPPDGQPSTTAHAPRPPSSPESSG